jgi:hypothetical protein
MNSIKSLLKILLIGALLTPATLLHSSQKTSAEDAGVPQFTNVTKDNPQFRANPPVPWYGTGLAGAITAGVGGGLIGLAAGCIGWLFTGKTQTITNGSMYGAAAGAALGGTVGVAVGRSKTAKKYAKLVEDSNGLNIRGVAALGQIKLMKRWHKQLATAYYNPYKEDTDDKGNNALHCAAGNGHTQAVETIIATLPKARVKRKLADKTSYLMSDFYADVDTIAPEEIDWRLPLISHPHNAIDSRNIEYRTALNLALRGRYPETAAVLMHHGAHHSFKDKAYKDAEDLLKEFPPLLSNASLQQEINKRGIKVAPQA